MLLGSAQRDNHPDEFFIASPSFPFAACTPLSVLPLWHLSPWAVHIQLFDTGSRSGFNAPLLYISQSFFSTFRNNYNVKLIMINGYKRNRESENFHLWSFTCKITPQKMKERKNPRNKYCGTKWENVHCIGLNLAPHKSCPSLNRWYCYYHS